MLGLKQLNLFFLHPHHACIHIVYSVVTSHGQSWSALSFRKAEPVKILYNKVLRTK